MKCPYCKTIMVEDDTEDYTYYTCKCPGNVIVYVKVEEDNEM